MKIEIENVYKKYKKRRPKSVTIANSNINLTISSGEIVGFLGANGAGKTTLIKMICNLVYPSEGVIKIDGEDVRMNPQIAHSKIGVVLEGARNVYNFLTIEENLDYFSYLNHIPREQVTQQKEKLLQLFSMVEKRKCVVNSLSRGMQQKVAIMIAILKNPQILILDEPTLGLDIVSQIKMREVLLRIAREEDRILIISTHDMALVNSVCNRAIIFDKGKVIADKRVDLYSDEKKYKIILMDKPYIRRALQNVVCEMEMEDGLIECVISGNINWLKDIELEDVCSIEKKETNIEEILQKIEETSYESN